MSALRADYLPHYTYQDMRNWEGRWEIINGLIYAMSPMHTSKHQRISNNIAWELNKMLADCKRCKALLPVDWKVSDDTVVQPDNLVVCDYEDAAYITKTPVVIFEVLSPSTAIKDATIKFDIYEREGVKYYCMVDPNDQIAKLYILIDGRYAKVIDTASAKVPFDIEDCHGEFDFSQIWE